MFMRIQDPFRIRIFFSYDVKVKEFTIENNCTLIRKWDRLGNEIWILRQYLNGQEKEQYYIQSHIRSNSY